jgi:DNA-binding NarL/FixJ family response regulator
MRALMAARLVLLDSDPLRREALARVLAELGPLEVFCIATVAEASAVGPAPDLFLIEGPSLAANDEGGAISPNPFAASGIPAVLMLPEPTSEQRRMALRAGYIIVLAAPVPPRLLYRRIAHLLQNARRAKRRAEAGVQESRSKPLEQVAPAEVALFANVPAE